MTERSPFRYVDLSGYGFSGKHAAIDLLREFDTYHVPHFEFEFCLLRIQGGILELESALHEDWSPIRSDAAIRRFRRLIRRLGVRSTMRKPWTLFAGAGYNYDQHFNGRFLELSNAYVDSLVTKSWVTNWPYPLTDLSGLELFARRLANKLGIPGALDVEVSLACPHDFVNHTRRFLDRLLSSNVDGNTRVIVMHNAFEPFQPQRCLKYFDNVKSIVIDRDPRDIYVQQLSYRPVAASAPDFIVKYRVYREAAKRYATDDAAILRMRFEDLVLDYDRTLATVLAHLGETEAIHTRPRRYFDPSQSRKNVGLWKSHPHPEDIQLIESELSEYCYL